MKDSNCFDGLDGYKGVIEASDVVLIANAAKFHPLHALAAIQAGKHVFVEKPHGIDPYGAKMMAKAIALAKQKHLAILSGLHSRYHLGYQETIKRIHDGAIGDIVSFEENFLRQPYGVYHRHEGWTELQNQLGNQYHFVWLGGDDVQQSLVHLMDCVSWMLKGELPVKCHGLGGQHLVVRRGIWRHLRPSQRRLPLRQRRAGLCLYPARNRLLQRNLQHHPRLQGPLRPVALHHPRRDQLEIQRPHTEPHFYEHVKLFEALRKGEVINCGDYMINSTMIGAMGQISCYTGKEVTWEQINQSDFHFPVKPDNCRMDMEPPVKPGPDGRYAVYMPGVTKLI